MEFLEMGAGSHVFSGAADAAMRSGGDSRDGKEYNGKGNIWKVPRREGAIMGKNFGRTDISRARRAGAAANM
jgi:hypothetical protein